MIFPEPRKDRLHQQGIAFISTLVFAILGFGFLSISELEIQKTSREVFRRVDMSRLMPFGLKLDRAEPSEYNNTVQLIAQSQQSESAGSTPTAEPDEESPSEDSGSEDAGGSGTRDMTRPASPVVTSQTNEKSPLQSPDKPVSRQAQGTTPTSPIAANPAPANNGPGARVTSEGGIPKLPLDSFGRDYKNLEVREIINWMKANPSELPKGIRQLVRFRPAFLSSVATFTMEGKEYELYLMCKESLFEVHVVLVENNEATYLVDRSFQKLSTYLRKGKVRRTQGDQIIAVRSNMASNDSSDEFYALFLSWWDWASQALAG